MSIEISGPRMRYFRRIERTDELIHQIVPWGRTIRYTNWVAG